MWHWIRQIGRKGPILSPSWSQLVMLCWSWARIHPHGPQIEAMWRTWRSKSATWDPLVAALRYQRRHEVGKIALENTWKHQSGFRLGPACHPFWSRVDLNLGRLDPSWAEVRPCCGHVGPKWWIWTMLYRSAKCFKLCKLQSHYFLAPCLVRKCLPTPSWSRTSEQRIVGVDRLRPQAITPCTFGAGGFSWGLKQEVENMLVCLKTRYPQLPWFVVSIPI